MSKTTNTTQVLNDLKEQGRVFAHDRNWGGLDEHPNSTAYKASLGTLYFFAGREVGQMGLSDEEAMQYFHGVLAGATEVSKGEPRDR